MSNFITISYGDTKDSAKLMEAALSVLAEAGAELEIETVQLGAAQVKLGFEPGFDEEVLNKIRRSHVLLKAPTLNDITTPLRAALGEECSIFEPSDTNLTSLLNAATMALKHLKQDEVAARIEAALAKSGKNPQAAKLIKNLGF